MLMPMEQIVCENPFGAGPVYRFDQVGSTMDTARGLFAGSHQASLVVTAGHQTTGRGRIASRSWSDSPGSSLLVTVAISRESIPCALHELPLRTGEAVCSLLTALLDEEVRIKWPNDILVHGRKICGILCESTSDAAYMGIGINCLQREFPQERYGTAHKRPPTSIVMEGGGVGDPLDLLPGLLAALYDALHDEHWRTYLQTHLFLNGRQVAFLPGEAAEQRTGPAEDEIICGIVRGIDDQGGLVIAVEGTSRSWYSGELLGPCTHGPEGEIHDE